MAQVLQLSGKLSIMPPPVLEEIDIDANGMYEGKFNKVNVDIKSENPYSIDFDKETFLPLDELRKMITKIDAKALFEKTILAKPIASRSMTQCFAYLEKLTTINVKDLAVNTVTNFSNCFSYCTALTELDLSGWACIRSSSCGSMFSNCTSLQKIWLPASFNPSGASAYSPLHVYTNKLVGEHTHVYTDAVDASAVKWGATVNTSYIMHWGATHEEYEEA